ncbi:site-specific DNA-methyltransferase [Arcanobacterium hippocoleae]|uniref:Adenine-specific DNA-methyltransferase n=1 Tax=Arcanobacterium hippocoleae TaxID=149017 RepID=A0ABU1SZJ2_9ACTO|nr:DNA methyltransferase [Arcanobacterium hippocoleae]MDR6938523.1 adenine-specific DNA-methyltransferase [Arcanobacterium hippocoleae]
MIRDAHEYNETVTPNEFDIERLRATLPEYFDKDGEFMLDKFQACLTRGGVNLTKEGYELKFLGKSYAKYLTSTETETVVVPDLEHNSQPENKDSENLYIVGDNLDALKHLLGSYAGKVKCIYIDPPYNTGSDGFIYNDDFGFTSAQLVDKIGLSEDEAERVLDLQGKSSHSAWLTFMYPRLQLAKQLLSDDGVIFISIDNNELANLRLLCDEIFGEQNAVATLTRKALHTVRNSSEDMNENTDFVVVSLTNRDTYVSDDRFRLRAKYDKSKAYNRDDQDGKGPYKLDPIYARNYAKPYTYTFKNGIIWTAPEGSFPRYSEETLRSMEATGQIVFSKDGNPSAKRYLWTVQEGQPGDALLRTEDVGYNSHGTKELAALLNSDKVFSQPKPTALVKYLISLHWDSSAVIMDFFSGSGTTADALMQLNAEDNGNRRFILVQLPECIDPKKPAYDAGYRTIDEIGRERIKRAAAKIKGETGADIDYGFRLYRLEEPSGQVLDDLLTFDPKQDGTLLAGDYVSKFDLNGTPGHDTVLATWLVKDGYGLTTSAEKVRLESYELDVCGDSAYIISPGLTSDDVVELVRLLENGDLAVSRVVVFGYSVTFSVMHELKKNLSVLKSGRIVSVIERL